MNHVERPAKLLALFASDVHLDPSLPLTTKAFLSFLKQQAPTAEKLYLLGDLFEYWAGDDDIAAPYHQMIVHALRAVRDAGTQILWIAGNRDFLVADRFSSETGAQILTDPSLITLSGLKLVITHGDAQCTDDSSYMAFRQMVRQDEWQKAFLSRPLIERKMIIESMRKESIAGQKEKTMAIMDVNSDAIERLFHDYQVQMIIHGHTHRPARHQHRDGLRYVLPDWDCDTNDLEPRGGWLEVYDDGQILFRHLGGMTSENFNSTNNTTL
jgi:UDP-2,3-diacylglucosamine hydrolase